MRTLWIALAIMLPSWVSAQTGLEGDSLGLGDLPAVEAKPKLPGLDESAPVPDMSNVQPSESPSVPQIRVPPKEADKAKEEDWAAEAMLAKKEEAKKKEKEEAALAEAQAKEKAQAKAEKEEKTPKAKAGQPTVAGSAVPGFGEADAQKLPVVTGLEGVKPRAMASGDGRVQPGFDSFTGPSSTGPLGKDFQSGAKPIMTASQSADGRMQVPPKAPEAPSGSYKRISQDPNSLPQGYLEPKPAAPAAPKPPLTIAPNPDPGDTKRVNLNDTKAGYSPYDNSRKVPDPRSQRRF